MYISTGFETPQIISDQAVINALKQVSGVIFIPNKLVPPNIFENIKKYGSTNFSAEFLVSRGFSWDGGYWIYKGKLITGVLEITE